MRNLKNGCALSDTHIGQPMEKVGTLVTCLLILGPQITLVAGENILHHSLDCYVPLQLGNT